MLTDAAPVLHTHVVLWSRAESVLRGAQHAELTYAEVGATQGTDLPDGYRHVHLTCTVGSGRAAFITASDTVLGWEMHRGAGLRVATTAPVAQVGAVVLVGIGAGPMRLLAPCRVVHVTDDPDRAGFSYGTLPSHPESGEERFEIMLRQSNEVVLTITAFSRPATWYARLGGPLNRAVQDAVTERYARSVRRAVRRGAH